MSCRIALQLYTVRDHMQSPDDVAKTLKAVADIGYRYVEVCGWAVTGLDEMVRMLADNGLTACSTHCSFADMQTDVAKIIADHETLGCKFPGIGGMPGEYRTSGDGFATFARLADEVGAKLADAGLSFCYHNHSFELAKFDGKTGLDILVENSSPRNVHNELDVYWVQHGGGSPVAWLTKLADRTPLVHFKDMAITTEMKQVFAEVGEGNLDWPSIIAACRAHNVQYCIVEQDVCPGDSLDSVKISFENMKAMGLSVS